MPNSRYTIESDRRKSMVIRHSKQLLEQLSEVEEKIQVIEQLMEHLNIDCDREKLIKTLLAKKYGLPSGQQS
jgi:hypothetical protein